MNAILKRLREPSTFAGLAALAVVLGVPIGTADAVAQVVGAVAGLLAVILPERVNQ